MPTRYTPERTRIDVHQFHRMAETGILDPEARIELLDGDLLNMAPIGPQHAYAVTVLSDLLGRALAAADVYVTNQGPVILSRFTEPQPDILVLRGPAPRYREHTPRSEDVLLLVEVSDATLSFDRGPKLRAYARAGIEEVWILNLQEDVLEVHRRPGDGVYAESFALQPGDVAAPLSRRDVGIEWARAIGR